MVTCWAIAVKLISLFSRTHTHLYPSTQSLPSGCQLSGATPATDIFHPQTHKNTQISGLICWFFVKSFSNSVPAGCEVAALQKLNRGLTWHYQSCWVIYKTRGTYIVPLQQSACLLLLSNVQACYKLWILIHRFCPDVHFNKLFQFLNLIYMLFETCTHSDSGNIVQATFRLMLPACQALGPTTSQLFDNWKNIICTGLNVPVVPVQSRCEVARASINTRQADAGVNGDLTVTTLRKEKACEHGWGKKDLRF